MDFHQMHLANYTNSVLRRGYVHRATCFQTSPSSSQFHFLIRHSSCVLSASYFGAFTQKEKPCRGFSESGTKFTAEKIMTVLRAKMLYKERGGAVSNVFLSRIYSDLCCLDAPLIQNESCAAFDHKVFMKFPLKETRHLCTHFD